MGVVYQVRAGRHARGVAIIREGAAEAARAAGGFVNLFGELAPTSVISDETSLPAITNIIGGWGPLAANRAMQIYGAGGSGVQVGGPPGRNDRYPHVVWFEFVPQRATVPMQLRPGVEIWDLWHEPGERLPLGTSSWAWVGMLVAVGAGVIMVHELGGRPRR